MVLIEILMDLSPLGTTANFCLVKVLLFMSGTF